MSTASKLRVLFIANWWYPIDEDPILGIFMAKHARAISRQCRLVVVHVHDRAEPGERFETPQVVDEGGVSTIRVGYVGSSVPLLSEFTTQIRYSKALGLAVDVAVKELGGVDLMHVNLLPPPSFLAIHRRLGQPPFILTEHASDLLPVRLAQHRPGWLKRIAARRLTSSAAVVTTPSSALRQGLESLGCEGRFEIVRNVVDCDIFRPAAIPPASSPAHFVHVSGLTAVKNVEGLLAGMARLLSTRSDVVLHIVGDGSRRPSLETRASELGMGPDVVQFHGRLNEAGVAQTLASSHALVLFSQYENSPCVVAEAAACGLPVVATNVGGIPELVPPSCGLLIPAGDEVALAAAMATVADQPEKFDREAIRKHAISQHGAKHIAETFIGLYCEASRLGQRRLHD